MLGIASPSKVFAEIGGYTGEGMAEGVEDSSGGVHSALTSMVEPPAVSRASASAGGGSAGGGAAPNFDGAIFNFHGVKDAADAADKFGEVLLRILEGDVASLGEAAPA